MLLSNPTHPSLRSVRQVFGTIKTTHFLLTPRCTRTFTEGVSTDNANTPTTISLSPHLPPRYKAVVVGAGPAGVAVVGNLLDQGKKPILWIDNDKFSGGRLNKFYREVPSNTKVKRFVNYAEGLESFKKVIEETEKPNAYTVLKDMDQEKTCHIAEAADLCIMLTKGFDRSHEVYSRRGRVRSAELTANEGWKIEIPNKPPLHADMMVLCTGSHPTEPPYDHLIKADAKKPKHIALDEALQPSYLPSRFTRDKPCIVAVIGASHSAILVLRNLYNLASSGTRAPLRVKWFTRHPLRYAEEMDGWIRRDNTGLKGEVATWAKENLENDKLDCIGSEVGKYITKINTRGKDGKDDIEKYSQAISKCTHIVQAVGYGRNPLPKLLRVEEKLDVVFDHETGGFREEGSGKVVEGLYGAGIAFPERVTDPEGNVEMAVGLWKFMAFLKRVVPKWTGK